MPKDFIMIWGTLLGLLSSKISTKIWEGSSFMEKIICLFLWFRYESNEISFRDISEKISRAKKSKKWMRI